MTLNTREEADAFFRRMGLPSSRIVHTDEELVADRQHATRYWEAQSTYERERGWVAIVGVAALVEETMADHCSGRQWGTQCEGLRYEDFRRIKTSHLRERRLARRPERACATCGESIRFRRTDALYCSTRCRVAGLRARNA